MSTKIYNAYICHKGFHYTHLVIEEIRKDYEDIVQEYIKNIPRQLRNICVKHFEDDAIVIYPLANGDILFQLFIHNLPYTINSEKDKALMRTIPLMLTFNKIKDYHYQDQSDPWYSYAEPPLHAYDLAKAKLDYVQREKDWNEVFNKQVSWTPAEVGYTIPMIRNKIKLVWR